jgi:hypothetical protein
MEAAVYRAILYQMQVQEAFAVPAALLKADFAKI